MAADGERIPVILDTGMGPALGDFMALALLLRAPAVELRAVTTIGTTPARRAHAVKNVLAIGGQAGVPVGCGPEWPLVARGSTLREDRPDEEAVEGAESDDEPAPYAVDMLADLALAEPGILTIVTTGPLTNLALAMARLPSFAGALRRVVIAGGIVQRRLDQLAEPYAEQNIRRDPEAAQIVLASGAPITLVPLDVTGMVRLHRADLPAHAGDGLTALLAQRLERQIEGRDREWTDAGGALAAALPVRPELVRTARMRVAVETRGDLTRGQTVATLDEAGDGSRPAVDVALGVDAPAFRSWLASCLAGPRAGSGR